MKITSTKSILALTIVLLVILIAANYFFFISIKNINTKNSLLSEEVSIYKKEQDRLAGKSGVSEILGLIEKVNSYYVGKDAVVGFIENIEKEARTKGTTLLIRSVDTENFGGLSDEESVGATKEIMRLKLEVRGSWRETMEFVSFLEHLPYKVTLVSVDFTKSSEGNVSSDLMAAPGKDGKTKAPTAPTTPTVSEWRAKIELTVLKQK